MAFENPPLLEATAPPAAVLFDAYGTLFDVYSVGALAEALFPGRGAALTTMWRDKQIEYSRLVTTTADGAGYRPFSELTRLALDWCCARLELPATAGTAGTADRLMAQYDRLDAFAEAPAVLGALRSAGVRCGVLSNGDPAMLEAVVRHAGLGDLLDPVLSVHPARRFKTHPAAYALGTRALGLDAAKILFVSSNGWDALGATAHGYRTLWVNRTGLPRETLAPAPTHEGSSLSDVLVLFGIAAPA